MEPLALQITASGFQLRPALTPARRRPRCASRAPQQPSPPQSLKYPQLCCKISCFKILLISKHLTEIHGHWAVLLGLRKAGNSFPSARKALKRPSAQRVRRRTRTCPTTAQPRPPEVTLFPPARAGELSWTRGVAGRPRSTAQGSSGTAGVPVQPPRSSRGQERPQRAALGRGAKH